MNFLKQIKLKELLRFLVGGGSAVLTDFTTYHVLLYFGVNVTIAKSISFWCGAVVGYVINKYWTFSVKKLSIVEIARYIVLIFISGLANTGVNNLILKICNISILAFLCATGVSTIMNFLGQKFFVFRKNDNLAK